MDNEETELRNPFPSPPSHYKNYTSHNLALLALLKERATDGPVAEVDQQKVLSDQKDVPEWSLLQLEKPRVDWILEDPEGYYDVFGDRWFIKEKIPSLEELGGTQLYPSDPSIDRRPALRSVLRSMLVAYSTLTQSMRDPPPTYSQPTQLKWQRDVEWITVLAQNLMAAANDLRPVQARENLELMMKRQLELRRDETKELHSKCAELEQKLAELRSMTRMQAEAGPNSGLLTPINESKITSAAPEEVIAWAEEV